MRTPMALRPIHAPCVVTHIMEPFAVHITELCSVLYKLTMLYIPSGWHHALSSCSLHSQFPNLIDDITYGSPIGNPLHLRCTFIPDNLASVKLMPQLIFDDIEVEIAMGRVSGLYTVVDTHIIFTGNFCTSPLGLIEKTPGSNKWQMIQHLSKQDIFSDSTNSWLDLDDFPTKYYSASETAEYVSLFLLS